MKGVKRKLLKVFITEIKMRFIQDHKWSIVVGGGGGPGSIPCCTRSVLHQ